MLRSMTGYGRGEATIGGIRVEAELSSVNRKQLEVRLNLPRSLASFESRLVEKVQGNVSRGQVSGGVMVHVSSAARCKSARIDHALAAAYIKELRRAAVELKLSGDLPASVLLQLPDVVRHVDVEQDADDVWPALQRAFDGALKQLVAMREREGAALAADIGRRLKGLAAVLHLIGRKAPDVSGKYRLALLERLRSAGVSLAVDDPALVKDLALFAERADISEEVVRLGSHLKQAGGLLKSKDPAGRPLDFLAQEMFREINTIGSKANDVSITREVIGFKTELERIREQVQNIE
jgi:uncharacterized protein (TIGR00255 family)